METADIDRMREYVNRISEAPDHTVEVLTLEERQDLSQLLMMRLADNERGN